MTDGPFLSAAFFCDQVVEGKDGALSAIRIIDQHATVAQGPDVPADMPPTVIKTTAVIMVKAGRTLGRYSIRIVPEDPSGRSMPELEIPVNFTGTPEQGINVILPMQLQVSEEGLYWFDIFWVDGRGGDTTGQLLTRIPLRVVYQPQQTIRPPEQA